MTNIVINTCEKTSTRRAVSAVARFIIANSHSKEYKYSRDIKATDGVVLTVSERHTEEDKLGCDCSFQVVRKS